MTSKTAVKCLSGKGIVVFLIMLLCGASLVARAVAYTAPSVTTNPETSIGATLATLKGNLTSKGGYGAGEVDVWFQWRVVGSSTWNTTTVSHDVSTGVYSFTLSGLDANTTYEFRAVAYGAYASDYATSYGTTRKFTTLDNTNSPPVITEGASTSVTMDEDGSPISWNLTLHATDADSDTIRWGISTAASHGTATASGTGSSKSIGYAPTANYNGSDSFVVQVSDGHNGTDAITVTVTATPVNDVPSFTQGADQTVLEDCGLQTVAGWASSISAGPADEAGQAIDFIVTNDNTTLFSTQPALAANGTLTYTPAANGNGAATVTIRIHDNGGTASGGVDTSASQTFLLTVHEVNDAPTAVDDAYPMLEDGTLTLTTVQLLSNDLTGPANESGQSLVLLGIGTTPANCTATLNAGAVTVYPSLNFNGTASFDYTIQDNGTTAGVSDPKTATGIVSITVTAVNDAPVNTTLPAITGIPHIWRALATTTGDWSDAIDTDVSSTSVLFYTYQWQRSADGGSTFTDITGATGSSYLLTLPDNFQQVRVQVTCSDTGVSRPTSQSTLAFSLPVTILNAAPVITEGSAVSTSCDEDESPALFSLTLHATDADEIDTLTWHIVTPPAHGSLALPVPSVGSSATPVYHPAANWNGSDAFTLRVEDRLTEFDNITVIITVNPRNDAPVNTVRPSIAGNLFVSHEVRAVIGNWNDSVDLAPGHLTYTYQWLRARDAAGTGLALIPGATASTYIVAPIDEGMYLAVRVICTDDGEGLPVSMSTSADSAFLPVRYLDMMPPTIELPDFSSWPGVTGASGGTAPSFTVSQLPFDLQFMVEDNRSSVQWKVLVNGVEASSSIGTGTIDRLVSLTEGTNPVDIRAVDAAGNTASRHLDISVDTHAPVVTLARPLQSMVTGTTLNVEGTISDGVSGVRSLSIDGTEVIPYLDGMFTVSLSLKRGLNTIAVETLDNAGNHGSLTWVLDLTPVPQQHVRHTIDLTIDSAVMVVDGASVTMDVAPVIREDRTLLPLRALVEELGGSIAWNAKTRQVTVKAHGVRMVLTIGKNMATVNGKSILIDPANSKVVPVILGNRTFLLLRFIAEQLGLDIGWYPPMRTLTITWEP